MLETAAEARVRRTSRQSYGARLELELRARRRRAALASMCVSRRMLMDSYRLALPEGAALRSIDRRLASWPWSAVPELLATLGHFFTANTTDNEELDA